MGHHTCIDLYECNPEAIRDTAKIKQFVAEMCVRIDMKPFGETRVVHFGEDERVAGFSMTQLIETSLISGHFANRTNAAYLDVFSCRHYDSEKC
jgi:S-adenosylmethionine/arginine decarboxylase-like enzyme